MRKVFSSSVDLERGGAGLLPLADFAFLGLNFSMWGFLAVVPWVYTFEEVLWDER